MSLTREQILGLNDIAVKEIVVPQWRSKIYIRQLTRGQQDEYLKRQYGSTRLKQDTRAQRQEISEVNIYGHDAFLFVCGVCDSEGKRLFAEKDIPALLEKNGEAIGFVATEIVSFSGMSKEVDELKEMEQQAKN